MNQFKIAQQFAKAIELKDIEALNSLLDDHGEFNIQNAELETVEANKDEFIKWIINKAYKTEISKVDFDQCLFCKIGNQVVLFNNGKFPRKCQDDSEVSRTGLMLDIQDDIIIEISFCYRFLKYDNKFIFECRAEKIKEFQNSGLSLDEAIKLAFKIDDSTLY